jgi:DNA-binding response OmpR family regulator
MVYISILRTAMRILILSDDPHQRTLFQLVFEREGYETLTVTTVKEALSQLKGAEIDLFLMDLPLEGGGLAGWDFYKSLKTDPDLRNIPIVVYTARFPTDGSVPNPKEYGDEYLVKPLPIKELLTYIRKLSCSD